MLKKVLLIGANGYVGSKFYSDYKDDYDFTLLDACWHDEPHVPGIIKKCYSQLSKQEVQSHNVVVLLAAHSSVPMCKGNFLVSYKNNVAKFADLLQKLKTEQKFIYASSSSVYGYVDNPVDEEYVSFKTYENYDTQKIIIDLMMSQMNLDYYGLRFGTVNGYAPVTRDDIMLNSMTKSAIENNEIYITNSGTKRPILAVRDLSRAVNAIINNSVSSPGVYNLASFNSNVYELGRDAATTLGVRLIDKGSVPVRGYDFAIDSQKFCQTFNFTFEYDSRKIVKELYENVSNLKWTTRKNSGIKYE